MQFILLNHKWVKIVILHLLYVDLKYSNFIIYSMDIIKIFGTNLKRYRLQMNLSQEKFAEKAGLHRTYISDLERFQRSIALDNIQKIADAIGIEPYKLLISKEE